MSITSSIYKQLTTGFTARTATRAAETKLAAPAVRMAEDAFTRTAMAAEAGVTLDQANRILDGMTERALERMDPARRKYLARADRHFKAYRDAQAALVAHVEAGGGSNASLVRANAALQLVEDRVRLLGGAPGRVPTKPVTATTTEGMVRTFERRADAARERSYEAMGALVGKLDAQGQGLLFRSQETWTKYVGDAAVTAIGKWQGGTGERVIYAAARERLNAERLAALKALLG